MSKMQGALVADVDDGGAGIGAPGDQGSDVISDTLRRPAGIVPTDGWGDTTDPRVLVAAVALIGGMRAASIAQKALQQM